MKLSVVIPMYNCCDNVAMILNKLKNQQNGRDIQVIVVNDGSEEDTKLVESLCRGYGFEYYSQENSGEAMARNAGKDQVNGDYFTFIDADDDIEPYYLDIVFSEISSGDYDIITNKWRFVDGTFGDQHGMPLPNYNVWANIYKTDAWKSLDFDSNIVYTCDTDWLQRGIRDDMKRLDTANVVNIYHVDNENSLTRRWLRGEIPVRKSDIQE